MDPRQGHGSEEVVAFNSKYFRWKFLVIDRKICYDNARGISELLTF